MTRNTTIIQAKTVISKILNKVFLLQIKAGISLWSSSSDHKSDPDFDRGCFADKQALKITDCFNLFNNWSLKGAIQAMWLTAYQ